MLGILCASKKYLVGLTSRSFLLVCNGRGYSCLFKSKTVQDQIKITLMLFKIIGSSVK